ncbi:unnamed protein product, partial [Prorocentrum cordatum]
MRAKLAELKELAEDSVMEDSLKPQVEALQERVDQAQAKLETKVPRCFTECRVVRDRKRVVEQRGKCKGRVEELEAEVAKAQEKLQTERSNLERYEQKLDPLNQRISELSVAAPGKGWSAAVAVLEQAAKCLAEGPNQQEGTKLKKALAHALQQQTAEKERIAQAETAKKAEAEAARAAKEVHERDSASQGGTKNRHLDTESKKEDLLKFEAGSSEEAIAMVLTTGGVTPEQAAKCGGCIKLLLDGLDGLSNVKASQTFYAVNANTVGSLERIMNDIYKVTPTPIILAQELQASQAKLAMFLATMSELILQKWVSVATATHHDWILGGDFNMKPAVLRASGLLGKMQGGIIHDQQQGTCERGDGTGQVREAFNVSPRLPGSPTVTQQTNEDRKILALQKPQRWPLASHGRHAQCVMDAQRSGPGVACELHLSCDFTCDEEDLSSRQGHLSAAKYKWTYVEAKAPKEASKQQAWAEGAEWLAHRLRRMHKLVKLWRTKGTATVKDEADRTARTILSHSIIMPLRHVQEERQQDEPDAPDDGHEDAEQQLISEGETSPDFPREGAEVVENRLAAGAPPPAGQLPTWDTVRWPDLINTVGALDVHAMDDKELHHIDRIATWLDLATRRGLRAAQRASAASWAAVGAHPQTRGSAGALHRWTRPPVQRQPQATGATSRAGLGEPGWHPRLRQHGGRPGRRRGFRNLGLLPELALRWKTVRMPCARQWGQAQRRAYDWATRGRSSERAAWVQGLLCEATVAQDLEHAVTYFDRVKCFEYVARAVAWRAGLHWGFNRVARRGFVQYWHPLLLQAPIYVFGDELTERICPLGTRTSKEEKHLGVTTAAGRRRRVGAFSRRALKFAARRGRIARVRRAAWPAAKIVRQAKVPSLLYGVEVMGMADTKLGELRQSVANSLQGNTKGRSTFLAQLTDDVDPGTLVNSAPILAWAQAWRETADSQLGWMAQAAHSISIGAEVLDLRVVPIHALQHHVKGATEQGLKDAWLEKRGEKLRACSPCSRSPRGRSSGAPRAGAGRRRRGRASAPSGAEARGRSCASFQRGAAESDTCRACRCARGADRHRTFARPAREAHRREVRGHHIVQRGANPGTETALGPRVGQRPRGGVRAVGLAIDGHLPGPRRLRRGLVAGDAYTDGNLLHGSCAALRRGGWSLAQLTPDMRLRFACCGPQPGAHWQQAAFRSELETARRVLEVACPPLTIWADCQSILDGFARGPAWAERPSTMHSETWSRCWALIAES